MVTSCHGYWCYEDNWETKAVFFQSGTTTVKLVGKEAILREREREKQVS